MEESQQLKEAGLKITLPRLKILQIFEQSTLRHLSAEEIYTALADMGEEVGLATVYRVLAQFEAAGLIHRHHFDSEHSVFELNKDDHHDHVVCIKCRCVVEFCDELIEERQAKIAKEAGFQMTDHALTIYGLCPACV
ncbi:MAG: ferric iron uptake transcriptional regulator [Legionellaceae bacterium]